MQLMGYCIYPKKDAKKKKERQNSFLLIPFQLLSFLTSMFFGQPAVLEGRFIPYWVNW